MNRYGAAAACGVLGLCATVSGQAFAILGHDESRALPCGAGSFSFITGNVHASARAEVLNPANFGPSGVVGRPARLLPGVPEIDGAALASASVVVLPTPRTPLTACEQRVLRDFVEQGGGVFALFNQAATSLRGVVGCGTAVGCGGGAMTYVNTAHPVLTGPFGPLSGAFGNVFQCRFESLGPAGTAIIASDAPVAAAFSVGLGRVVVVNEEEWAMSTGGCPSAPFWDSRGRVLFLNAVAWVIPNPGFAYQSTLLECYPDCEENCVLDVFDFLCFQNLFDAGDPYACDCDAGSGPGVCDIFDFLCFQNSFAAGCP